MGDRLVLDLETQKEFSEVEGRKPELLGVSVVGVYSYAQDRYDVYLEADLKEKLAPVLQSAELLIGFNIRRFDLPVLQPYMPFPLEKLTMLDMLEEVTKHLGHRVSLDSIAQASLGKGKTGNGLDALRWFKEGRFDLITQYCLDDVRLTKEVYEYGREHGRLFALSRFSNDKLNIPVFWPERKHDLVAIAKILQEACAKRLQVQVEYLAQRAAAGESPRRVRAIDIYQVAEPNFEGFCHFRKDVRQFRIDRILDIKPTWQRYTIPPDYLPTTVVE